MQVTTSLTRESILASCDLPTERIDVPEWGGCVEIRTLTAGERDRFDAIVLEYNKPGGARPHIRAELLVRCIVDADGKNLFTVADVEKLAGKSARAVERVFNAALRLNGITNSDVEELEKNSVSAPGGASSSGSPSPSAAPSPSSSSE
ncbi:MAG: hypothetical protein EA379_09570 [Phycisphaerales bacterium]|nr:MAG: hypothetical protein EA379_09570 [Phycisphaerales bacterium]